MTCPNCGKTIRPNPFKYLLGGIGQWGMAWFLGHMTPDAGSWGGAENFFVTWHWLMWWMCAVLGTLGLLLFLLAAGAWMSDPDRYFQPHDAR